VLIDFADPSHLLHALDLCLGLFPPDPSRPWVRADAGRGASRQQIVAALLRLMRANAALGLGDPASEVDLRLPLSGQLTGRALRLEGASRDARCELEAELGQRWPRRVRSREQLGPIESVNSVGRKRILIVIETAGQLGTG